MIRAFEMSFTSDLQSRPVKWTCAGKIELIYGRLLLYIASKQRYELLMV